MAPRITQEISGNTMRNEITVGPAEGNLEGRLDAAAGPQVRVSREGEGVEVAASVSASGSLDWPVYQRAAIEATRPEVSLGSLLSGRRIDPGQIHTTYDKLTLGLGLTAEGSFGGSQGLNLYPGLQARFQRAEVAANANGSASADWEAHLRVGPAVRSVVSTEEGDRAVGGFVDVGVTTLVGKDSELSVGGGVTAAVYDDAVTVTPGFQVRWK